MPAVLLVLTTCVLALYGVGVRVALTDVAAQVARQYARGDDPGQIRGYAERALPGIRIGTHGEGDLVCATTGWRPPSGPTWLGDAVGTVEICALREEEEES